MPGGGTKSTLEAASLGTFSLLPDTALAAVLVQLSPAHLATLACCSRKLRKLAHFEPLWRTHALKVPEALSRYQGSWRRAYVRFVVGVSGNPNPEWRSPSQWETTLSPPTAALLATTTMFRSEQARTSGARAVL